jgi:hypothetical protein
MNNEGTIVIKTNSYSIENIIHIKIVQLIII